MPQYDAVQSDGKVEKTASGAVRSPNNGKGRFDLLSVHGMIRLAKHYENGAKKYCDRNWETGMSMSRYCNSALRHLFKYIGGDRSEDHLAAIAWNAFALIDHEERIERGLLSAELNDLPEEGSMFTPEEFIEISENIDKVIPVEVATVDLSGKQWSIKEIQEKMQEYLRAKAEEDKATKHWPPVVTYNTHVFGGMYEPVKLEFGGQDRP